MQPPAAVPSLAFGVSLQYRQETRDDGGIDMVLEALSIRANNTLVSADGKPRVTGFPAAELGRWDLADFLRMHEEAAAPKPS